MALAFKCVLFLLIFWILRQKQKGSKDVLFEYHQIKQLFLFVEQRDQLEVWLPYSRLLTGIPILAVFQNLRGNSNETSLLKSNPMSQYNIFKLDEWIIWYNIMYFIAIKKHKCALNRKECNNYFTIQTEILKNNYLF